MSGVDVPVAPTSPAAPDIDDPIRAIRSAQRSERQLARATEAWLHEQSFPMEAVQWVPHWHDQQAVETKDASHLGQLISTLEPDDWGGVRRRSVDAHRRSWVQVRRAMEASLYLVELWPADIGTVAGNMLFDRALDLSAGDAAALAWAWVRGETLPSNVYLEPRVVPQGHMLDCPL